MGYSEAEASITMERCGPDSSIAELTDFICVDQMAKVVDAFLPVEETERKLEKKLLNEDDHAVHISIPMIGYGVPTEPDQITQRTLPEDAIGPPYFYYENVALDPVGVWTKMSRYLYDVEPDFVGSVKLTEMICKALEAYEDESPSSVQKISDAKVAFYCLGISLKTDVQELNDDRLEQLMSRFVEFDLVVSGIQLVSSAAPIYPTLFKSWNGLVDSKTGHLQLLESFLKFKFSNLLKDIMDIILTKKMIGIEEVAMMYQDLSQHHGITRVQVVTCSWLYDVIF
ncbi:Detected protein of confused Function [Hibiscus syriacus]|uniref:Detected protein of confused Function n=1 Tax=Hibiscus syriacus TaxID=106335 RepID=A0A6A3BAJ6_HIBSY|nr:Detected protein of confused Function [Hibiscus syriacus]